MNTADLNGDGWLDLIATSYGLPGTLHYDFGTYLFWGSPNSFDPTNAQRLPGFAGCGINVADYDADGYLDVFVPNYKLTETRESISSFLFWGSVEGYSELNRTDLMIDSGHAAVSADFNGDGRIDLAVGAHSRDGDHTTHSRVYYNDARRFANPGLERLPTIGPHYMYGVDVGNLYDRSYRQTYRSSVFRWQGPRSRASLSYVGRTFGECRLEFSVRSAPTPRELDRQPWSPLSATLGGESQQRFGIDTHDRCLQYQAAFISDNGDRYPILDKVTVSLSR
jgi:hypothetical protein